MASGHIMSPPALILFLVTTSQVFSTVFGRPCDDECENRRPGGTDGPYTLYCSSLHTESDRKFCGLKCRHCEDRCHQTTFSPENDKISCEAKPAPSTGLEFLPIVIIVVVVLLLCGLCIGIPACIFCCRQSNRYPMMGAGYGYGTGAVYPAAMGYRAPQMMMGGGGAMMTTTTYNTTGGTGTTSSGTSISSNV